MSHIPASAMPHATANGDATDDGPSQAQGDRPSPEPTTATPDRKGQADGDSTRTAPPAASATQRAQGEPPLSSAAPGTATGNRSGGDADSAARVAGPSGGQLAGPQPGVDGTVTAQDGRDRAEARPRRSRVGVAALAMGGVALIGGVAAVLFPKVRADDKPKGKKRKGRKKG